MRTPTLLFLAACLSACSTPPTPARQARDHQGLTPLAGGVEEKKVPYAQELRYPDNWPEISATRDAGR